MYCRRIPGGSGSSGWSQRAPSLSSCGRRNRCNPPSCVVVPGYHHPDVAVELLGTFGPSAFRDLIAVYAPGIEAPLPEHIPGYLGAVGAIQLIEVVDSAVVVLVPGSSVLIL